MMDITIKQRGLLIKITNIDHMDNPTELEDLLIGHMAALRRGLRGPVARWIWRIIDRLRGRKA